MFRHSPLSTKEPSRRDIAGNDRQQGDLEEGHSHFSEEFETLSLPQRQYCDRIQN
jgi:hypothetical protein